MSIGAARQRQQTRIVDNNRGVRQAPNARFIDASSVEIAGKNAERTDAEIKAFIDGLSPIVETVGKSIIQQKANDQLGELIRQDPEIGRKYLQGDPDTQARINSLNGYTKELFIASQKQSALSSYKELLPSLLLADERITGANALKDPEAYAAAESEIKQKAMQMSGLTGLPTDVLGAVSPQVGQINGAVRGKAYAAQNTDQQRINLTTIGDGQVRNTVELAEGLDALKGPDTPPEETKRTVGNAQLAFAADVKLQTSKGVTSPQKYLATYLSRAQVQLDEYRARGEWEKADSLLNTIELLAAGDLKLDNGLNFWEQSIPAGKDKTTNVNQWLIQQRKGVNALQEQVARREGQEMALPLAKRAATGDNTARLDLLGMIPTIDDPQTLLSLMKVFAAAENFGDVMTVDQLDLLQRINDPNRDKDALGSEILGLMRSNQLPMGVGLRLYGQNLSGQTTEDRLTNDVLNASSAAARSGQLETAARDLAREQAASQQRNNLPIPEDLYESNLGELKLKAFEETMAQQRAAIEAGQPMSQDQLNQAFVENINKERDRRIEKLRNGQPIQAYDTASVIANDLNEMEQNIKAGKTGVQQFPQRILELARQKNIPLNKPDSYRRVQGLMIEQMKLVIGPDGRPEFAKPGEELEKLMQRGKKAEQEQRRGFYNRNTNKDSGSDDDGYSGPTRPSDRRNQNNQSSNPISQALTAIAGAITPGGGSAANAGELPASVLNEDQTELLAKMWAKREAPTMRQPPLPQVDANAATQSVPVAITNDRHPFFVAIGIAEGTRTASGEYTRHYYGHTDQGDGNNNRGTVSGGRGNNMTPEQVDRQWMGVLTQQGLKFQSVLRGLGLSPGTQGYNRTMFNALDLSVQAPSAVRGFLMNLRKVSQQGWSVEALAKARADAFYRYDGTLDTTFPNYQALFRDQRSRAGVWDYRRRL